ncbi:hypothetical protein LAZ67_15000833 [Cordylochernes scorpioides]|uniref:Uncharacterized protein n=1 Tax=Cordylochernes scorpioides TaxID=51811 RepID=A0ABY6LAB4_9ARAC|nr:hypothetical protein LAZ67_15000833 [Cordylochernes scorpioides]
MAFEDLLEDAGGFGLYQKLLAFVFLPLVMANSGLTYWTQIFSLISPPHRCSLPDTNDTSDLVAEFCEIRHNASNLTVACSEWNYDYSELFPNIASEVSSTIHTEASVCDSSTGYAETAGGLMPSTQPSGRAQCSVSSSPASFRTGNLYPSDTLVGSQCVCRFGRRCAMMILEATMIVMNILTIFMRAHWAFSFIRFLSGMTVLTTSTMAFLMSIEYTCVKKRTLIGVLQGVYWSLMAAVCPWIAYLIRDWRGLLGLCCIPSLAVLILLWWVPESASWLLTRGRKNKAAEILDHIARVNGVTLTEPGHFLKNMVQQNSFWEKKPMLKISFGREVNKNKHLELQGLSNTEKPSSKEIVKSLVSVMKTPNLRKNIGLLFILWFGVSMCYNGVTIEMGNLQVNLYVAYSVGALVELSSNMYFWAAATNLGRRWANFVTSVMGAAVAVAMLGVPQGLAWAETLLTLLGRLAWAASYDVTLQYSAELLPTVVRGRGVAVQLMVGDLGNCVAPFVVYLTEYNTHYPLLVFGAISVVSALLALALPETCTEPLPQSIEDGRDFGKGQSFFWTCPRLIKKRLVHSLPHFLFSCSHGSYAKYL